MTTKTEMRKVVTAWIDPELVVRLDDAARAADRSRSAEVRLAILRHVEHVDDEGEHDE